MARPYPHRYGNHIEDRGAMVNFSIVGRDCTLEQRKEFFEWDNKHQERKKIAAEEARRRRERLHRRKIQPRIIITFGNGGIDRYRHHPNCRCNRCWWAVRYRPLRRQVDVFIHVRPRAHVHRDHHHRHGRDVRKLWHDGLRTRTDRTRFRR